MNQLTELTAFFGWCTVINFIIFLISALLLLAFKDSIAKLHSKLSGVEKQSLLHLYFQYLGNYKIFIIVFSLTPYIALKMIGS